MKFINFILGMVLSLLFLSPLFLNAQSFPNVIIEPNFSSIKPGSLIEVKVLVSSEQKLNAFNIDLEYSPELFSFERSYAGNSVVTLWKSLPLSDTDGNISLTGGSVNSWYGERNEIITLIFKARRIGASTFGAKNSIFILADGVGTKIESPVVNQKVVVAENAPHIISETVSNQLEIFGPTVINDPQTKNPILVLDTPDPGSIKWLGIRSKTWLFWGDWQKTQLVSSVPGYAWSAQFKALGYDGEEVVKTFYQWRILIIKLIIALTFIILAYLILKFIKRRKSLKILNFWLVLLLPISSGLFFFPSYSQASTISISPGSGTFSVGSTFEAKVILDTDGESINALDLKVLFPADILQVVTPTTGESIVGIWTSAPRFDNKTGEIFFQGGIPEGINTSGGLISNLTFRVNQTGNATLKFSDSSRVLLNDGFGTDSLHLIQEGFYSFVLPPPEGPSVVSQTHPDQSKWYSSSNVALSLDTMTETLGYSFVLNSIPVFNPDNTVNSTENFVSYSDLENGIHYFHVKALGRGNIWGGVTNFAIKVDTAPPAGFPLEIRPSDKTTSKTLFLHFVTTDANSGVDHYEYSVIPLNPKNLSRSVEAHQTFFIETTPPEIIDLDIGKYDILVRAYDKVGNYTDSYSSANIIKPVNYYFSNIWAFIIIVTLTIILLIIFCRIYKWHGEITKKHQNGKLPEDIKKKVEELKRYKKKYGTLSVLIIILGVSLFSHQAIAKDAKEGFLYEFPSPVVTNSSRNITNQDIFYIGGKTHEGDVDINIFLQNLETNETRSFDTVSDEEGIWFYRHETFLPRGEYILWVQSFSGEITSPPSPQQSLSVSKTAIQIGSSRVSFETLVLILNIALLIFAFVMFCYILILLKKGKEKSLKILNEAKEAEEALRRGFALLRKYIEAELATIHKAKIGSLLSEEQKEKEFKLLKDLEYVERFIGKEIWDIEKYA